jgi:hypothetical protein
MGFSLFILSARANKQTHNGITKQIKHLYIYIYIYIYIYLIDVFVPIERRRRTLALAKTNKHVE